MAEFFTAKVKIEVVFTVLTVDRIRIEYIGIATNKKFNGIGGKGEGQCIDIE
mgnify:CR=1 FL=1